MYSWLTKFRISTALDAGKPLPDSLRKKIAADPELERFVKQTEALGHSRPALPPSDPSMHDTIMRAVRASTRRERPQRAPVLSWLTASVALVALALVGALLVRLHGGLPGRQMMDQADLVLEMSETMPTNVPSLVMAPLSDEWTRVNHDVRGTAQILLASLP